MRDTVPVLCVHGDLTEYPSAEVRLEINGCDSCEKTTKVPLIPKLPVQDFDLGAGTVALPELGMLPTIHVPTSYRRGKECHDARAIIRQS